MNAPTASKLLTTLLLLFPFERVIGADSPIVSRVSEVTLYREQALVTRVISLRAASGLQEILVNDLPEQIVPESLFAEGVDGVEVRAVRFRAQALSEEPRNEVRAIDESIERLSRNWRRIQEPGVAGQTNEVPGSTRRLRGADQPERLARGVLDAGRWKR